jgi:hypothetical protein
VLTINPAKAMKGTYDLPASPDLFVLAVVTALVARRSISITPCSDTPLVRSWIDIFKGCASFEILNGVWHVTPVTQDPSQYILITSDQIPYRDLTLFMLLGMGKTVAFTSISEKRIERWKSSARKYGISIETALYSGNSGLTLVNPPESITVSSSPEEEDISMILGLVAGLRQSCTFTIDTPYTSPLRTVAPLFGFELSVKSLAEKENDPIARRIKMMQKKSPSPSSLRYALTTDFSATIDAGDNPVPVTLPGDEILSALLLTARCLIQKGSFVLGNIPLETWCAPVLTFIRKMGTKITAQETGRTSFGSTGIVSMQKIELVGRKLECRSAQIYAPYIPSLTVLAAYAQGQSVFRGIDDLRYDQPDGIDRIESCIRTLGARHGEMPDGIVMEGGKYFDGFDFSEALYPALSGAFAVAGLRCIGVTTINDDQLKQRWPDFESVLTSLFEYRA